MVTKSEQRKMQRLQIKCDELEKELRLLKAIERKNLYELVELRTRVGYFEEMAREVLQVGDERIVGEF